LLIFSTGILSRLRRKNEKPTAPLNLVADFAGKVFVMQDTERVKIIAKQKNHNHLALKQLFYQVHFR